ncbi:MAG: hypothetical protein AB7O32_06875 [Vicinamibacterales bacterium]
MSPIAEAVHLLRGLYAEMPGCCLTTSQAARLSGLDLTTCEAVLIALIDARVLRRSSDGRFIRTTDGVITSGWARLA